MSTRAERPLTRWLETAPAAAFVGYAVLASFTTYFAMYAFRKPFAAASYEGTFLGSEVSLKTAFVISQVVGYTLSKYLGIKLVSEVRPERRRWALLILIGAAELALLAFALLPGEWRAVAIFANGLPLGMVWGMVVRYLEGRRTSELLLAGLSTSFIVASGVVKDIGRWLMDAQQVSEPWMPFTTGLLFLPVFALAVWLLDQLPAPSAEDVALRVERPAMTGPQRRAFLRRFFGGLVLLFIVYFFLTAYRDFRDNYGVEIFAELGYGEAPAIFTRTELPVAFGVLVALALLNLVKDNRRALAGAYGIMIAGALLLVGGTVLFDGGHVDGATWMVVTGLGSYLVYVPFGSVLFDRLIASTGVAATAVFTIYVADALGYTGSVGVQLYRDLASGDATRLVFFHRFSHVMGAGAVVLLTASLVYFMAKTRSRAPLDPQDETHAG